MDRSFKPIYEPPPFVPRVVAPGDDVLWQFASALQPNEDVVVDHFNKIQTFCIKLANLMESLHAHTYRTMFALRPSFTLAGSFRNKTNISNSDVDLLFILNPLLPDASAPNVVSQAAACGSDTLSYKWPLRETPTIRMAEIIQLCIKIAAQVEVLSTDATHNQVPPFKLVFSAKSPKLRFSFVSTDERDEFHFDLLPALLVEDGSCLFMDGETGAVHLTDPDAAARNLAQDDKLYIGLRDMIKTLKVAAAPHKLKGLSSSAIEAVTVEYAHTITAGKWRNDTFKEIFCGVLKLLLDRLEAADHRPLHPLNNKTDDLLRFLKNRTSVEYKAAVAWLRAWVNFDGKFTLHLFNDLLAGKAVTPQTGGSIQS